MRKLYIYLGVRGFLTSPCSDSILFLDCFVSSGCGCFQSMSDATSGSFNISLQLSPGIQMGIKHDGKQEKQKSTSTRRKKIFEEMGAFNGSLKFIRSPRLAHQCMIFCVAQFYFREGCKKSKWKFKMAFAIRRPTPPLNGTNFQTFFTPLFFFCN